MMPVGSIRLKRAALWAVGLIIGLILLATMLLVTDGLRDKIGHADMALVLGNTVLPDGTPSPRLQARLDKTLELYRAGHFPTIIVSGGIDTRGHDEAAVMRDYLAARGVPAERIIADNAGINTFCSARNTQRILRQRGLHSVFVVSQYFHLTRAKLALRRFGVREVYAAHARYFEPRDIYSSLRETVGCIEYFFRRYDPGG